MSETTVLHLGNLIKLQCCLSTTSSQTSVLVAKIYHFSTFQNIFECTKSTDTHILGNWSILKINRVTCFVTRVLQPCVLLIDTVSSRLALYQLRDLCRFVKICEEVTCGFSSFSDTSFYLTDGPRFCCVDFVGGNASTLVQTGDRDFSIEQVRLPHSVFPPLILKINKNFDTTVLTFLAVSSTGNDSNIGKTVLLVGKDETSTNVFGYQWFVFEVILKDQGGFTCEVVCNKNAKTLCPPSVYCSITTAAILLEDLDNEGVSTLFATSCSQIILARNGEVMKCCDLDIHVNCDQLLVIGSGDLRLVLAVDQQHKHTVLALSLSSLDVLKIWTDVKHTSRGNLIWLDDCAETFLVIHSCTDSSQILPGMYTALRGLDDVLGKVAASTSSDKTRQGLERNSDEMEDMFALSPMMQDEEDQGVSESLNKVIKSLEVVRDRHAASVDDLRRLLRHQDDVLQLTSESIRSMNKNVYLNGTPKKLCKEENVGLVDLFSGEPAPVKPMPNSEVQQCVRLIKTWQKVVKDQWMLGFHLELPSSSFGNFAVVLTLADETSSPTPSPVSTRTTAYDSNKLLPAEDSSGIQGSCGTDPCSEARSSGDGNTEKHSDKVARTTSAASEKIIVAAISLNDVDSLRSAAYCCVVTATRTALADDITPELHHFHLGKVSMSATTLASDRIGLKPSQLLAPSSFDDLKEDFASLMSYSVSKTSVLLSSEVNDVCSVCEAVLTMLHFRYSSELQGYLCGCGPLLLMFVRLRISTRRRVTIHVLCSAATFVRAMLLLSCYKLSPVCGVKRRSLTPRTGLICERPPFMKPVSVSSALSAFRTDSPPSPIKLNRQASKWSKREEMLLLHCITEQVPADLSVEASVDEDFIAEEKLQVENSRLD